MILFSALIIATFMMFVWRAICVKFGPKDSYLLSIIVFLLALLPLLIISGLGAAIIFSGLLGIGLSGIILISDLLISDVIDHDEKITGARREGMYFGVNAFICRFAIALEAASIGFVFYITKYNPVIFTQPKAFMIGLRFLIAGIPMAALAAAFAIMFYYPLSKKPG
jgi:GPH family glycoside/pentoside/hexuronide:cation symporter